MNGLIHQWGAHLKCTVRPERGSPQPQHVRQRKTVKTPTSRVISRVLRLGTAAVTFLAGVVVDVGDGFIARRAFDDTVGFVARLGFGDLFGFGHCGHAS